MYDVLFSKGKIGKLELKNRVVMPAMMVGHGQLDGSPTEQMMDYYEERAKGGVALIISEIARVYDKNGAGSLGQLAVSRNFHIKPLKEMIDRIHKHDCKFFVQLHHPGYQNEPLLVGTVGISYRMQRIWSGYQKLFFKLTPTAKKLAEKGFVKSVVGPSKVDPCSFTQAKNRALSKREIIKIENAFAEGALRAQKAGADGVEVHAAHGYLIQQFLSPRTNNRTDEYGGSLENRTRFLINIIRKIREKCGDDFPISIRLTADECYNNIDKCGVGYTLQDGVEIAKIIAKEKIDAINVSSATYETMNYWLEPTSFDCGWRAYMAKTIKEAVNVPIIAANFIRSAKQAEEQLENGTQDFVALGRPHIADPDWVNKVKEGRENEIKRCIACIWCFESMLKGAYEGKAGECAVNPIMGHEAEFRKVPKDGNGRKITIVGAGPAGLVAGEILAKRGFNVTIYEKNPRPGGQAYLASVPPKKDKLGWVALDGAVNAEKAGAKIIYNTAVTKEMLDNDDSYAIIFATGGFSIKPRSIKGIDKKNAIVVTDILDGKATVKDKKVILIGSGMTGLESSMELIKNNNQITVIEMLDDIAKGVYQPTKDNIIPKLKKNGVKFFTSHKLLEILDDGIIAEDLLTHEQKKFEGDIVILSLGVASDNKLFNELKEKRENVYAIGDAIKSGRIAQATRSGYNLAINLK